MSVRWAYAFTVGLVAAVNPCGFAMLPAYLSYFLGVEKGAARSADARLLRAVIVSITVSAGIFAVFTPIGLVVNAGAHWIYELVPWFTVVIGLTLIGLGIAMAFGWRLPFATPKLERGGKDRTLTSMFVFGVSYAVASISCTLPVFITVAQSGFSSSGFAAGVATFLMYVLGMTAVLTVLTLALALAQQGVVKRLRRLMAWVDRISVVLILVAGAYLTYYGIWEVATDTGRTGSGGGGVIDWAQQHIVTPFAGWAQRQGGARLGLFALIPLAAAVSYIAVVRWRRSQSPDRPGTDPGPGIGTGADTAGAAGERAPTDGPVGSTPDL